MGEFGLPDSAIAGLPGGAGFALVGVGIVLLYRVVGVISFAQGGIGIFGAMQFASFTRDGAPWWVALPVGLAISALIGTVVGLVMARWFLDASIVVKSALTIAIAVTLSTIALRVYEGEDSVFPSLVRGATIEAGTVTIPGNTWVGVVVAVVVALGAGAVVKWTRLGVATRAVSERAPTAALLGVRVGWFTVGAWALNGALAAMALILIAPTRQADAGTLSGVLVEALAAALLANFVRFSVVLVGGLVIGMVEGAVLANPDLATYAQVVPLVAIVLVLAWARRGEVWDVAR